MVCKCSTRAGGKSVDGDGDGDEMLAQAPVKDIGKIPNADDESLWGPISSTGGRTAFLKTSASWWRRYSGAETQYLVASPFPLHSSLHMFVH